MKCYFCQSELGVPFYHGVPSPVMLICGTCPKQVEYYFGAESKVYEYRFFITLNRTMYDLVFRPNDELPSFQVYKAEGNLRFPVFHLKQIPSITPNNAEEKLKTYLLFS